MRRALTVALLLTVVPLSLPQAQARPRHGRIYGLTHFASPRYRAYRQQRRLIRQNARRGDRRERRVQRYLRLRHPLSSIQAERYLRDAHGRRIVDRKTKQARRYDFAVVTPTGRVKRLVEVTSRTADKRDQQAKADRIMRRRKNVYIKDTRSGKLRPVSSRGLHQTRIDTMRLF